MHADPIPLRPVNVGALIEAAEASGLSDDAIGRLIVRMLPEALVPSWELDGPTEPMIRRAVEIARPRLRVVGGGQG